MGGRRDWCKHYNGLAGNKACMAEVDYSRFKGVQFDSLPCLNRMPEKCDKACYRTTEEIAAEKKAMDERFANTVAARLVIVEKIGEYKKGKSQGASGTIDCPVCKSKDSLHYSRAGYNGHIHAACETEGCVRWME